MPENTNYKEPIFITEADLPLSCPMPDAPLWARHPKVFLNVLGTETAKCPYCSAQYIFSGTKPHAAH